jgi:predicted metal-dependent HD superfamily phosphohydrolase
MDAKALAEIAPLPLTPAHYQRLIAAYALPPRAYHSFAHVLEVAAHWQDVQQRLMWQKPRETFCAVLYHDAIYVAGSSDNEERSAEWARGELDGLEVDRDEVARLIVLTASHGKLSPGDVDRDTALFLDCDMAILGAPAERFAEYQRQIREEYAAIPDDLFRAGRSRFLERVLNSERIFLSDDFHRRFDARARANLAEALTDGDGIK